MGALDTWWVVAYLVLMAGLFLFVFGYAHPPHETFDGLTDEEVGYLAGGARRAVQVAVAKLTTIGAVKSSDDVVTPIVIAYARSTSALDRAVLEAIADGTSVARLTVDGGVHDELRRIRERLVRAGLERPHLAWSRSTLGIYTLFGSWIGAWIVIVLTHHDDRALGLLGLMQLALAGVGQWLGDARFGGATRRAQRAIRARRGAARDLLTIVQRVAVFGPGELGAIDPRLADELGRPEREAALANALL